jgi:hypothetical protein
MAHRNGQYKDSSKGGKTINILKIKRVTKKNRLKKTFQISGMLIALLSLN